MASVDVPSKYGIGTEAPFPDLVNSSMSVAGADMISLPLFAQSIKLNFEPVLKYESAVYQP